MAAGGGKEEQARSRAVSGTETGVIRRCRKSFDASSFVSERVDSEIQARYDIDRREIGVGGYGKIYIAKDRMFNNRLVAIKKVVKTKHQDVQDFQREVTLMKGLDHPNICKLFETYNQERLMFFVLEHCEGGDLCDRILDHGPMTEEHAGDIIRQVASALIYAHGKGIAHRDMKPENVCFCDEDPSNTHVKIIDWGLGKHFALERMKSVVGSSDYTAPEVLESSKVQGYTSMCDLWSLGVLAYVTLSGGTPFFGSKDEQLSKMRREEYWLDGDDCWDNVSNDAKNFIRALLKKDPLKRPQVGSVLKLPWMRRRSARVEPKICQEVLANLEEFSHAPDFFSICVASVARQLDHRSLRDVHRVFCMLDADGDGVLTLPEFRAGFEEVFGADNKEFAELSETFSRLDLDGSGRITYTEFCAAGIGEGSYSQEHALWAAFKTFDLRDDGLISKEELTQALTRADVSSAWSPAVCDEAAREVMLEFAGEDGSINFEEWMDLMRRYSAKHLLAVQKRRDSGSASPARRDASFDLTSPAWARQTSDAFWSSLFTPRDRSSLRDGAESRDGDQCPCGNVYMPGSKFCPKCGRKTGCKETPPSRWGQARDDRCPCGNVFMPDSEFCRMCGRRRVRRAGRCPPERCLAGACGGFCIVM